MTDHSGNGGVHGSKELYTHLDLRTNIRYAIPTSKKDDEQTLRAIHQIYGNDPQRLYYSDNWKPLRNTAHLVGLQHEGCLPGVHETNCVAESDNRKILSGSRGLLMQVGLPACCWPYAAPCFCFLESITLSEDQSCSYYERHGTHFPG